jgi:hypothetical protein
LDVECIFARFDADPMGSVRRRIAGHLLCLLTTHLRIASEGRSAGLEADLKRRRLEVNKLQADTIAHSDEEETESGETSASASSPSDDYFAAASASASPVLKADPPDVCVPASPSPASLHGGEAAVQDKRKDNDARPPFASVAAGAVRPPPAPLASEPAEATAAVAGAAAGGSGPGGFAAHAASLAAAMLDGMRQEHAKAMGESAEQARRKLEDVQQQLTKEVKLKQAAQANAEQVRHSLESQTQISQQLERDKEQLQKQLDTRTEHLIAVQEIFATASRKAARFSTVKREEEELLDPQDDDDDAVHDDEQDAEQLMSVLIRADEDNTDEECEHEPKRRRLA